MTLGIVDHEVAQSVDRVLRNSVKDDPLRLEFLEESDEAEPARVVLHCLLHVANAQDGPDTPGG